MVSKNRVNYLKPAKNWLDIYKPLNQDLLGIDNV